MLPEKVDEQIIDLLREDADLTYKEMGRRLRLNESTVRKRVLSLRKRGVIRRFMVEVDSGVLEFKLNASIGVDADPSMSIEVGRRLVAMPESAMVFNTSGGHDFFVIVWTKDRDSLMQIVHKIVSIEGVTKVVPNIMLDRLR